MEQEPLYVPLRPLSYKKKDSDDTAPETLPETEQQTEQQSDQVSEEQKPGEHKIEQDKLAHEAGLAIRIAQINEQKGSYRNATESQLLEEIEAARLRKRNGKGKDKAAGDTDSADNAQDAIAVATSADRVSKGRREMLEFAQQARNEVTIALNFVSLLLTKFSTATTARQVTSTIADEVKQIVPTGTIDVDYVALQSEDEVARKNAQDISIVSQGWKSASFKASSKKFRTAAARIDKEISAENAYWEDILRIKEKGWKIMRNPADRKVLAVQCASLEAGRSYKDRGLIRLRRAPEGRIIIDQGLDTNDPKGLRVRIERRGRTIGRADPKCLECLKRFVQNDVSDDLETEEWIRLRRDTLFEEELWHELEREARNMLSYGLEMNRNQIRFSTGRGPVSDQEYVVIDLADVNDLDGDRVADDGELGAIKDSNPSEETVLAHSISLLLRLLFSYTQRKGYEKRRTQLPRPLKEPRRPDPEYKLLRPVKNYLRHKAEYAQFMAALDGVGETLANAGFEWSIQSNHHSLVCRNKSTQLEPPSSSATPDTLISPLLNPIVSTISISCLSRIVMTVALQTSFDFASSTSKSPHIGVKFHVRTRKAPSFHHEAADAARIPSRGNESLQSSFTSQIDALNGIQFLIQRHLVDLVSEYSYSSVETSQSSGQFGNSVTLKDIEIEDLDNDSDLDFEYERELAAFPEINCLHHTSNVPRLHFKPFFIETGELSAFSRQRNRTKRLRVSLNIHEATLQVKSFWISDQSNSSQASEATASDEDSIDGGRNYVWSRGSNANNSRKTFKELIKDLSVDEGS